MWLMIHSCIVLADGVPFWQIYLRMPLHSVLKDVIHSFDMVIRRRVSCGQFLGRVNTPAWAMLN